MVYAGQALASIPVTPPEVWYRMGTGFNAGAEDLWWNRTEDTGLVSVVGEPEGWEGVTYVTPMDEVGGRHGALSGPASIAPKVLEVRGVIVAPTAVLLRKRLAAVRRMLRGNVVWEQYDWGAEERLAVVCRAQGDFAPSAPFGHALGGLACQVSFDLVAPSPWKYSAGDPSQVELQLPVGSVSGRTYDQVYPYNYGSVLNPGGQAVAFNRGDSETYPVFTILGPASTPTIRNETTGQEWSLNGVVPAGSTVTLDARTGVLTPSSARILGRPFTLAEGPNTIRWRVPSGTPSPDARLYVTWRSTWQ